MEVLKVVEKSLLTPPIIVPRPVLATLEKKMNDYQDSVGGSGPTPMPTRDDEDAKEVRQAWRLVYKMWGNIQKDLKSKDGVPATRLQTFLNSSKLKDFEEAWHNFDHKAPKTIDRSTDELKAVDDFANDETLRRQNASNVDQAKKDFQQLRDRYPKEVALKLYEAASEAQKSDMKRLASRSRVAQEKGKENWFEARDAAQEQVKLLEAIQDEVTFGEQRRENREQFALRVGKLRQAIEQLAAGKKLAKGELEKRKTEMRDRLGVLSKLSEINQRVSTWEPSVAHLQELVALWNEVYACRNDTGEVAPVEPGITVQHAPKIAGVKNKWSVWADKVKSIDDAFTSGLLEFSSTMQLTGNPGCRFHKQGDCWKFYLDEAEMGGSTTMRGWYRPEKIETGVRVTFIAISDSHSGPSEKVLYGEV